MIYTLLYAVFVNVARPIYSSKVKIVDIIMMINPAISTVVTYVR